MTELQRKKEVGASKDRRSHRPELRAAAPTTMGIASVSMSISAAVDKGTSGSKGIESSVTPSYNYVTLDAKVDSHKRGHEGLHVSNNVAMSGIASS